MKKTPDVFYCDFTDCGKNSGLGTETPGRHKKITTCTFCTNDYCIDHAGTVTLELHVPGATAEDAVTTQAVVECCWECVDKADIPAARTLVEGQISA